MSLKTLCGIGNEYIVKLYKYPKISKVMKPYESMKNEELRRQKDDEGLEIMIIVKGRCVSNENSLR